MDFKIYHSLTGRADTVHIDEPTLSGGHRLPSSPISPLSPGASGSVVPSSAIIEFIRQKTFKSFSVDPSMQLLLIAPSGSQLSMHTLQRELLPLMTKTHELFLYDKRLLSSEPLSESLKVYDQSDEPLLPSVWPTSPDDGSAQGIESILDTLVQRSRWATFLVEENDGILSSVKCQASQSRTIAQAASTALAHLQQYQTRLAGLASQRQQQLSLLERDIAATADCKAASRLLAETSCLKGKDELYEQTITQHYNAAVEKADTAFTLVQQLLAELKSQADKSSELPLVSFESELTIIQGNEKACASLSTEVKLLASSLQKDALRCRPSNCVQIYQEQNTELIPALLAACRELKLAAESIKTSKLHCQERLLNALQDISQIQTRSVHLRHRIKSLGRIFGEADSSRAAAAKAMDSVFLYGAVIVENNRRQHFQRAVELAQNQGGSLNDYERIEAAREQEANRIKKWNAHYDPFGVDSYMDNITITPEAYLAQLQEAGLASIQQELRQEYESSLESLSQALDNSSLRVHDASIEPVRRSVEDGTPLDPANTTAPDGSTHHDAALVEDLKAQISAQSIEISELKAQAEKHSVLADRTRDIAQRLYASTVQLERILQSVGLVCERESGNFTVTLAKSRANTTVDPSEAVKDGRRRSSTILSMPEAPRLTAQGGLLDWVSQPGNEELFGQYNSTVFMDYDVVRDAVCRRLKDVERIARKYYGETRVMRDGNRRLEHQIRSRLALDGFCTGDLVLFLPTRELGSSAGQASKNHWAAFNVGSPHYFLAPALAARICDRDFLIARVASIESHVVGGEDENPFELPAGTEWHSVWAKWRDNASLASSRMDAAAVSGSIAESLVS